MPSPNATPTPITPPRVPLIDPRTGLIDRAWYLFFLSLFNAAEIVDQGDLVPNAGSLIASYDAALQTLAQTVETQPLPVDLSVDLAALKQEVQTTPRLEIGTIAYQNYDNVNITGGKISGLVPPLPVPSGGTGFASYAVGDFLYADTTVTLAKLPDVATGNAIISGGVGVAPSYGKIGLTTHVSGVLPVANGGSGASTLTGYLYGNGTSPFTASTTIPNTSITGLGTMSTQNIGASGSFTSADIPPLTVTVVNGIITSIV